MAWGDKDPWEPLELGKAYADFDTVEEFVVLPNVGHCPQVLSLYFFHLILCADLILSLHFVILINLFVIVQDEAPDLVNPLIETFVKRHSKEMTGSSQ